MSYPRENPRILELEDQVDRLKVGCLVAFFLVLAIVVVVAMLALPMFDPEPVHETDTAEFSLAIEAAIPTTTTTSTTTTTAPPPPSTTTTHQHVRTTPTTARASRGVDTRGSGWPWAALAECESGGNPRAVSKTTPTYYGAFQFSLATWHSVGGTGNPIDHTYEHQLALAQKLQARSGWGQWPRCSRKLGLR